MIGLVDVLKKSVDSPGLLILLVGVVMIVLASAGGVEAFSIKLSLTDLWSRYIIAALGTLLMLFALFLLFKNSNSMQDTASTKDSLRGLQSEEPIKLSAQPVNPIERSLPPSLFSQHAKDLGIKLTSDGFIPDLIVGIARNGTINACFLSLEFSHLGIPVISLYPRPKHVFANVFNNIPVSDMLKLLDKEIAKIIIVDDICETRTSLDEAKKLLLKLANGMNCQVRTAAIIFKPKNTKIKPPNYFVRPEYDGLDESQRQEYLIAGIMPPRYSESFDSSN